MGKLLWDRLEAFGRRHPRLMLLAVFALAITVGALWLCKPHPPIVLYETF